VYSIAPAANAQGWHHTDVTVKWSVIDPESGIDSTSSGCADVTLTFETAETVLTCTARNKVGMDASASVSVKIDKTSPTLEVRLPFDRPARTGAPLSVTVVASEPLAELPRVSATGTCVLPQVINMAAVSTSVFTGTYTVPDGAGDCTVSIVASGRDVADNTAPDATAQLQVDRTAPLLRVLPIAPQAVGAGQSAQISVETNEALAGPPWVTVSGDCIDSVEPQMSLSGTQYTGTYTPPAGASSCTATVTARGTDLAANVSAASDPGHFRIDRTPPTLSVSAEPARVRAGQDAVLLIGSSEALSGLPTLSATSCVDASTIAIVSLPDNQYRATYRVPAGTSDCDVTVSVTGTDAVGNRSAPASATFTIDRTPPTLRVVARPNPARSGQVSIDIDASETLAPLEGLRVSVGSPCDTATTLLAVTPTTASSHYAATFTIGDPVPVECHFVMTPQGAADLAGNTWVPDDPANRTLTVLPNGPDLVVSDFQINPSRPTSGDTATFTVTIENVGSQPATGLTLDLDGQDAYGLFTFNPGNGWSCNQLPERVALDIRCTAPQVTLAAGAQTTVRLETRADPEIRADLPYTITAQVALSQGQEIDTSNNRRSVSGTVLRDQAPPELVSVSASPSVVNAGGRVTITARLRDTNSGPRGAEICYAISGNEGSGPCVTLGNSQFPHPDGDWTATIDVPTTDTPGETWTATALNATDWAGNTLNVTAATALSGANFSLERPTPTPTSTPTLTPTVTPTSTPTSTATSTATSTPTATPVTPVVINSDGSLTNGAASPTLTPAPTSTTAGQTPAATSTPGPSSSPAPVSSPSPAPTAREATPVPTTAPAVHTTATQQPTPAATARPG